MTNQVASRPLLELDGVSRRFGTLQAVRDFTLNVSAGERRAVIGPNGAGKTTLFNLITGTLPVSDGRIVFRGEEVTHLAVPRRARAGMSRTFQRSNLFDGMSAMDNVGLALRYASKVARNPWRLTGSYVGVERRARTLLDAMGLTEHAGQPAGELSHGDRRRLEIVIALATDPVLLLLDEPAAGLSAAERDALVERILELPDELSIIIVEHDMEAVFAIADRIAVMNAGMLLAEGLPEEIRGDPRVQEVYLGTTTEEELFLP